MNKLIALILSLVLPYSSYAAECQNPVKLLEEGSPAPCRGYLFSPEKELQVRIMSREYTLLKEENVNLDQVVDKLKKINYEYNRILELEEQKTQLWRTRAEDITSKYIEAETNRGRRDMLFVVLGVGLTVLAGWSMGQAAGR